MVQVTALNAGGLRRYAGASLVFVACTAAIVAQLSGSIWPTVTGLVFFAAGISHGAGDEDDAGLHGYTLPLAAAYLIAGTAIASIYLVSPVFGLVLFLLLSGWHFARTDCALDQLARKAVAGLAIGGSALFRPSSTAEVFTLITGVQFPGILLSGLALAGIMGLGCAIVAALQNRAGYEHAVLAVLATISLEPALAVGLIFLVSHALPVQFRQLDAYGPESVLKAVGLASLFALGGALLLGVATWNGIIPIHVSVALAFGFATPHMLSEDMR